MPRTAAEGGGAVAQEAVSSDTDSGTAESTGRPEVRLPIVAILGGGSMGTAVLNGLVGPAAHVPGIRVTTRTAAHAAQLAAREGVTALAADEDPEANRRAVAGAGIVVLAVKPHQILTLAEEIRPAIGSQTVVVSVAAGIGTAAIESRLPDTVPVVRAMPNTPAVLGLGVTGLSAGSRANAAVMRLTHDLFAQVGEVVEVPEERLDALSAVSGSGPAYFFYLVEKLTAAAVGLGFTPEEAALLVHGTLRGSAELLTSSGSSPAQLRRQVTSPHGTTERAVAVLDEAGLEGVFSRALAAAVARARELAAEA